jgi:hypothetical protein
MRSKLLTLALVGALGVIALGAPAVFGGESADPGSAAVQIRYRESARYSLTAGANRDFSLRCPRGWKAIEGYFASGGGIFEYNSSPGSLRRWEFGVANLTSDVHSVVFGVICLKGVSVSV